MVLDPEQFEAFKMEIATFGNIPILSQYCGIGCVFCKVHTDSYLGHYPKIPMIDEEDLLKGFQYINEKVNYVRLGAGVLVAPHTDPFLHPKIYDFIKIASDFDVMADGMINGQAALSGENVYIGKILEQVRVNDFISDFKCTLMFTGNLDEMKKDLELLYDLGVNKKVRQILVRRMEHTDTSQPRLKTLSTACINGYEECIRWVKANYPDVVFTVPILKDVFRGGNNEYFIAAEERIAEQKAVISQLPQNCFVNLISPLSGYDYFSKAYEDMPNVRVNLIENHLYGGSVSVAGLLNHADIKEQFHPEHNDVMILPSEMYNSEGVDIQGEPQEELSRYYKAKVIAI